MIMKEYYFQSYPTMRIIYAANEIEAMSKYRAKFPDDKREYAYTGDAFRKFVVIK